MRLPLLVLASLLALPASAEGTRGRVVLVPLGSFPPALLDAVEEALRADLDLEVERHPTIPLPRAAFYAPRRRYRAERLLHHMATRIGGSALILGLTEVDISTTKDAIHDWGIFGLGELGGRAAVVSTHRLRRAAPGKVRTRVATTAVHEVGHVLGLEHCVEARCLMRDAQGTVRTVDQSTGLGPACRQRLDRRAPIQEP